MQEMQEIQVQSQVGKMPWRRVRQPTPMFLPGEFHGQKSLMGAIHRDAKSQTKLKQLNMPIFKSYEKGESFLWNFMLGNWTLNHS